jgi:hypothetical protein
MAMVFVNVSHKTVILRSVCNTFVVGVYRTAFVPVDWYEIRNLASCLEGRTYTVCLKKCEQFGILREELSHLYRSLLMVG